MLQGVKTVCSVFTSTNCSTELGSIKESLISQQFKYRIICHIRSESCSSFMVYRPFEIMPYKSVESYIPAGSYRLFLGQGPETQDIQLRKSLYLPIISPTHTHLDISSLSVP